MIILTVVDNAISRHRSCYSFQSSSSQLLFGFMLGHVHVKNAHARAHTHTHTHTHTHALTHARTYARTRNSEDNPVILEINKIPRQTQQQNWIESLFFFFFLKPISNYNCNVHKSMKNKQTHNNKQTSRLARPLSWQQPKANSSFLLLFSCIVSVFIFVAWKRGLPQNSSIKKKSYLKKNNAF